MSPDRLAKYFCRIEVGAWLGIYLVSQVSRFHFFALLPLPSFEIDHREVLLDFLIFLEEKHSQFFIPWGCAFHKIHD